VHAHWLGSWPGSSRPTCSATVREPQFILPLSVSHRPAVYPTEYLNSLTLGGLPPHTLNIKVRESVMPLRVPLHTLRRYIVRQITAHTAYSMRRIFRRCWMNHLRTGPRATVRRVGRGVVEIHIVTQHQILCTQLSNCQRCVQGSVIKKVLIDVLLYSVHYLLCSCIKVIKLHA